MVCGVLPDIYVEKLLDFVASCLEKSGHLQFYMTWTQNLLMLHGQKLKNRFVPSLCYILQHLINVNKIQRLPIVCGEQVGSYTIYPAGSTEGHPETL